ncbi:hypothetical protein ACH5RR_035517 [Cinchona calisaya]|uniref:Response regulatory domain-containing protein n=1 Tax=Cinchona calisaya TaxID=153742 RepID=A0ABD2Y1M2_9GENT
MMMTMENNNGFSSPRSDAFPAGLRVLVVDDDPTWLKILEKMLKKCSYEVTTCGLAREALNLLRERKDGFDIVISDVNMPDMDGFKLLEHVGLEMDLPVIMMSVDGETSRVMKGVQHGACDYLLKPIRMKELRNIWQHVLRKRIHEVRDIEFHEGIDEIYMTRNGSDKSEDRHLPSGTDPISGKKRKDVDNKHDDRECNDPSSVKKVRVVWAVDLHQKFVKAVNQIGFDKVGPKKILDLMGVPWLTRENVASHLQKYRLYLGRLQKEKELTASFGGMKQSDITSKEPNGNHCLQNSVNKQCDLTSGNHGTQGNKTILQNVDFKMHEGDMKCIAPMPMAEPKKAMNGDNSDPQKSSNKKMGVNHSFGQLGSDLQYATTVPKQYSWNEECSETQMNRECKPHFRPKSVFNALPLTTLPQNIQLDYIRPRLPLNSRPSSLERDNKLAEADMMPAYMKSRSQGIGQLSPAECKADRFPVQPGSKSTNVQGLKSIPSAVWSMNNHSLDQILGGCSESEDTSLNMTCGTEFASWDGNLQCGSLQGDFQPLNVGPETVESFNYGNPELTSEVPTFSYDSLKFDFEYPFDSMEYPVIDQGLFIT